MITKKDSKAGSNTSLKCKVLGHKWIGDSLKRTCLRCGKTQVARFAVNQWVDIDVADQSAS